MPPVMTRFCCSFTLGAGTLFLSIFWIIVSCLFGGCSIYMTFWAGWTILESRIIWVDIINNSLMFLLSIVNIVAVAKESASALIPWMVFSILYMLATAVRSTLVFLLLPWTEEYSNIHIVTIVYLIIGLWLLYCLVAVICYYQSLKDWDAGLQKTSYISWPLHVITPPEYRRPSRSQQYQTDVTMGVSPV